MEMYEILEWLQALGFLLLPLWCGLISLTAAKVVETMVEIYEDNRFNKWVNSNRWMG